MLVVMVGLVGVDMLEGIVVLFDLIERNGVFVGEFGRGRLLGVVWENGNSGDGYVEEVCCKGCWVLFFLRFFYGKFVWVLLWRMYKG